MTKRTRTRWTDERLADCLLGICQRLGYFPSARELRAMGRNDLVSAVTRLGGLLAWAQRLGVPRRDSESDRGWAGESAITERLRQRGYAVTDRDGVKCPYDLLVDDLVRIEVKTARRAVYGGNAGWYFRIGRHVQADLVALHQSDTGQTYFVPWHLVPRSNVTITGTPTSKYSCFREAWPILDRMIDLRRREREILSTQAA